jgi:hypothetical protein
MTDAHCIKCPRTVLIYENGCTDASLLLYGSVEDFRLLGNFMRTYLLHVFFYIPQTKQNSHVTDSKTRQCSVLQNLILF